MSDDLPTSDSVTYVPSGCLYNEEIEIPCKGPDEKVFYTFSLQRRLRQNDTIIAVRGNADDKTIKLLFVSCEDKGFTVLISGGTLGNKVAIHFFVQTSSEEERSFTASLAIMPDGIVKDKIIIILFHFLALKVLQVKQLRLKLEMLLPEHLERKPRLKMLAQQMMPNLILRSHRE